jgi:phenylacetate-CoA ligase
MADIARRYVNPRIERASRADIEALQLSRLRHVIARAYATNPFYRRLYDQAGLKPEQIRTLADFRNRIPFIDKKTLLEDQAAYPPYGSRAAVPGAAIHMVMHTSGTSGIGQELHCLSQRDAESWTTGYFYECRWAGIDPGDRVVRFTRIALELGGLWHKNSGDRYGLSQFFLGAYDTPTRLRLMQRFSPHLVMTQPSYLTRLAIACGEAGIDPRQAFPDLKAIMFAGEAHSGVGWLQRMERFFGVKLAEWYGSTQAAGSHMFSCEHGLFREDGGLRMLHNLEHRTLFEVLDRETLQPVGPGEAGEVVLTNLMNETFPIIRFRNYDRVRFRPASDCECGRPFDGIESGSVSRYDDMIKLRGQNVWPDAVGTVVFAHDVIEEYQGVVWVDETGRERVRLQVEFRPAALGDVAREALRARLRAEIKAKTDVTMDVAEAPHGTLPRFEQKARRWTDERKASRGAASARMEKP